MDPNHYFSYTPNFISSGHPKKHISNFFETSYTCYQWPKQSTNIFLLLSIVYLQNYDGPNQAWDVNFSEFLELFLLWIFDLTTDLRFAIYQLASCYWLESYWAVGMTKVEWKKINKNGFQIKAMIYAKHKFSFWREINWDTLLIVFFIPLKSAFKQHCQP